MTETELCFQGLEGCVAQRWPLLSEVANIPANCRVRVLNEARNVNLCVCDVSALAVQPTFAVHAVGAVQAQQQTVCTLVQPGLV